MDVVKLLSSSNYLCVNISIAKALNPNAAILLSLLCKQYEYWRNRNELNNGYFYVTREKIYDKSGLTEDIQRSSEKLLLNANLIEQKRMGVPAKNHYKIKEDNLLIFLNSLYPKQDIGESHNYKNQPELDVGDTDNKMSEKQTEDINNMIKKEDIQEGRKEINTDVILQNNILKGTGTISGKQNKNPQTPFGGDAKKFKTFKEMIQEFTENEQLISELKKFTESYFYTHKIRLGSAQFEKLLITLKELSKGDDNIAVKIVSLSIESGWKKFYPLKDDKKEKKSGSFFTKADEQSYDDYEKGRNNLDLALDENGNPLVF